MSGESATNSSTAETAMSVQPIIQASRLLALPVEIQLQIYRHAWTFAPVLQGESREKDIRAFFWGGPRSFQLYEQLSAISAMGAVCRDMRSHVHAEFFSRTQAYISTNRPSSTRTMRDYFCSRIIIESSQLLREHLQHVCLVLCHGSVVIDGSEGRTRAERALMWLASLKSLRTLEVVFDFGDLGQDPMIEQDGTVIEASTSRLPWLDLGDVLRLPRLEKVVARLYARNAEQRSFSWEESSELKELKEEFEKLAPASEDTEQRRFKFHQHIGVKDGYDWPPYSYQI